MKQEDIEKIITSNREYFSSLRMCEIEDMLTNMAKHMFPTKKLSELNKSFKLVKNNDMFESASIVYAVNRDAKNGIKIIVNNIAVNILMQQGNYIYKNVSSFPSEFLYMFK